jgi:hypothetical protein
MKQYKSIAEWDYSICIDEGNEFTIDFHETEEQAQAVCKMLERDGYGGEGKIFPIETWVEKIKEC